MLISYFSNFKKAVYISTFLYIAFKSFRWSLCQETQLFCNHPKQWILIHHRTIISEFASGNFSGTDWNHSNCNRFISISTAYNMPYIFLHRNFRQGQVFIYRDALTRNWSRRQFYVEINMAHLHEYASMRLQWKNFLGIYVNYFFFIVCRYDDSLMGSLQSKPNDILPYFEMAAKDALKMSLTVEGVWSQFTFNHSLQHFPSLFIFSWMI